jgi:hypothetical protein
MKYTEWYQNGIRMVSERPSARGHQSALHQREEGAARLVERRRGHALAKQEQEEEN